MVDTNDVLTTIEDNGDGTITYTDENGLPTIIDLATIIDNFETVTSVVFDVTTGNITYNDENGDPTTCLLYTSPSPRDQRGSRMPSSA